MATSGTSRHFARAALRAVERALRAAREKIAKQFCAEAMKQSMLQRVDRWIASLRSQ
jgi:hypothetical protein